MILRHITTHLQPEVDAFDLSAKPTPLICVLSTNSAALTSSLASDVGTGAIAAPLDAGASLKKGGSDGAAALA